MLRWLVMMTILYFLFLYRINHLEQSAFGNISLGKIGAPESLSKAEDDIYRIDISDPGDGILSIHKFHSAQSNNIEWSSSPIIQRVKITLPSFSSFSSSIMIIQPYNLITSKGKDITNEIGGVLDMIRQAYSLYNITLKIDDFHQGELNVYKLMFQPLYNKSVFLLPHDNLLESSSIHFTIKDAANYKYINVQSNLNNGRFLIMISIIYMIVFYKS